jgi:hypothetical protein
MTETKTFVQRKSYLRLTFEFLPDKLRYTMRDRFGERQFSTPYDAIVVLDPSRLTIHDRWLSIQLGLLCFIALAITLFGVSRSEIADGIWAPVIFCVLMLAALIAINTMSPTFGLTCTLLSMHPQPPGAGNLLLRILEDKQHAAIFNEVKARWTARLRELHAVVNRRNDPVQELAKFDWLRKNGVLTDTEYETAAAEIERYSEAVALPVASRDRRDN